MYILLDKISNAFARESVSSETSLRWVVICLETVSKSLVKVAMEANSLIVF
jgi:hypothetical protein